MQKNQTRIKCSSQLGMLRGQEDYNNAHADW